MEFVDQKSQHIWLLWKIVESQTYFLAETEKLLERKTEKGKSKKNQYFSKKKKHSQTCLHLLALKDPQLG